MHYRLFFASSLFMLVACQPQPQPLLESIKQNKTLVVATRNAPTTYYEIHDQLAGFEYEMAKAFATELGVKVEYKLMDSTSEILAAITERDAHIAAAGLTITEQRKQKLLFGPAYQSVQQQVVCRRGGANPKRVQDLVGLDIGVPVGTSYEQQLAHEQQRYPNIQWQTFDIETESLLENVWLNKLGCTVADSNIVAINRRYYPELQVRFNLSQSEPLAWAMPLGANRLQDTLTQWFDEFSKSGKLEALIERYYGHIERFDYVDTRRFVRRIDTLLPKYKPLFMRAAEQHEINWTLLAAQAYQESHWRAQARSPTGVRGLMMLTRVTARELNIKNRLDPEQSILGGARYLSNLYERIPESVTGPDRMWFALAAYNVGMGHVRDARVLAKRLGKDPDQWRDLSEVLPLLSQKKYYKTLRHGYARGREPVNYVKRIRGYQDILLQRLSKSASAS